MQVTSSPKTLSFKLPLKLKAFLLAVLGITTPQSKTLTHEQSLALCEANCIAEADAFFKASPNMDTDENRRLFESVHRRAWVRLVGTNLITKENS
jgi:hypothetical protein